MTISIKQLQQPTWNSCVCTSIAMATGRDLDLVMEYHDDYVSHKIDEFDILKSLNVLFVRQADSQIVPDRVYLASVPSINKPGMNHFVVILHQEYKTVVYDPNKGKDGKKYYVFSEPDDDLEVKLMGWHLSAEIVYF